MTDLVVLVFLTIFVVAVSAWFLYYMSMDLTKIDEDDEEQRVLPNLVRAVNYNDAKIVSKVNDNKNNIQKLNRKLKKSNKEVDDLSTKVSNLSTTVTSATDSESTYNISLSNQISLSNNNVSISNLQVSNASNVDQINNLFDSPVLNFAPNSETGFLTLSQFNTFESDISSISNISLATNDNVNTLNTQFDTYTTNFNSLSNYVYTNMYNMIGANATNINDLVSSNVSLSDDLATTNSEISNYNTRISRNTFATYDNQADLISLSNVVNGILEREGPPLSKSMDSMDINLDNYVLQSSLGEYKTSQGINNKLSKYALLTELEGYALNEDLSGLSTEVEDMSTNIDSISNQVRTMSNEFNTISTDIGTLPTDLQTMTTTMDSMNNDLVSISNNAISDVQYNNNTFTFIKGNGNTTEIDHAPFDKNDLSLSLTEDNGLCVNYGSDYTKCIPFTDIQNMIYTKLEYTDDTALTS